MLAKSIRSRAAYQRIYAASAAEKRCVMPQTASRGVIWSIAAFWIVTVIAAPGVVSALTHGQARTTALLVSIGVELFIIACVGLYFRARGRP